MTALMFGVMNGFAVLAAGWAVSIDTNTILKIFGLNGLDSGTNAKKLYTELLAF